MSATYNGKKLKLRYLFTATFADGKILKQTPEDASEFLPPVKDENGELQGKSQVYDVFEYEKTSRLIKFTLEEVGIMGIIANKVELDMITGVFTVNGLEVNIADQLFLAREPLKLICFKETHIQQVLSQSTGQIQEERFYVNRFIIGWETMWTHKDHQSGKMVTEKHQRTLAVDGK